jgi:hypothetical protein
MLHSFTDNFLNVTWTQCSVSVYKLHIPKRSPLHTAALCNKPSTLNEAVLFSCLIRKLNLIVCRCTIVENGVRYIIMYLYFFYGPGLRVASLRPPLIRLPTHHRLFFLPVCFQIMAHVLSICGLPFLLYCAACWFTNVPAHLYCRHLLAWKL